MTSDSIDRGARMFELMRAGLPELKIGLDEWTRRMMSWHFSEQTGCAFWLRQRDRLGFDPVSDITCFADLREFGLFSQESLRNVPARDLRPRGFATLPMRVFETGGTSGAPCRIVNVTRLASDVVMYAAMLRARGLAGGDIIAMTPSGPHAYGHFVEGLADSWQGAVCAIDFDPRWVKHLLRAGQDPSGYVAHLCEQARTLLETREATLLFTTSQLLLTLVTVLDEPLAGYRIRGVCTGGTSCSAEEIRVLTEDYLGGVQWIDTYGNTLVGHALQADPLTPGASRSYHLAPPFGVLRVASPGDWTRDAAPGERGQVVATTLLEDLFIPNLAERDSAVTAPPHPWFPWPGVRDIRPLHPAGGSYPEGVY
ncbi:MAG TPA: hypothetical protein VH637_21795 [Streptosporangiaceae bacterium]|jgi:hypothetical protein